MFVVLKNLDGSGQMILIKGYTLGVCVGSVSRAGGGSVSLSSSGGMSVGAGFGSGYGSGSIFQVLKVKVYSGLLVMDSMLVIDHLAWVLSP